MLINFLFNNVLSKIVLKVVVLIFFNVKLFSVRVKLFVFSIKVIVIIIKLLFWFKLIWFCIYIFVFVMVISLNIIIDVLLIIVVGMVWISVLNFGEKFNSMVMMVVVINISVE